MAYLIEVSGFHINEWFVFYRRFNGSLAGRSGGRRRKLSSLPDTRPETLMNKKNGWSSHIFPYDWIAHWLRIWDADRVSTKGTQNADTITKVSLIDSIRCGCFHSSNATWIFSIQIRFDCLISFELNNVEVIWKSDHYLNDFTVF